MRLRAVKLLLVLLVVGPAPVFAATGDSAAQVTWTRTLEPIIVKGAQLPGFAAASLGELFVYAFRDGDWVQIPFQFDEVDANGAYGPGDGRLGPDDELVFMSGDLGQQAGPAEWIPDGASRQYVRYAVQVTNPLNPLEQAWAYVYRSARLVRSQTDYVGWDAVDRQVVATAYTAGLATAYPGLDALELNGSGINALDRTQLRVDVTCRVAFFPIRQTLTEGDLPYGSINPNVDGPVRVGGGNAQFSLWAYPSYFELGAAFDLGDLEPPDPCTSLAIDQIRVSTDWRNPAETGMAPATYYDDNTPAGVPIDGVPDLVAELPPPGWQEVTGGQGATVQVARIALGGGQLLGFYRDNGAFDSNDTGDGRSYGNAGYRVVDPNGVVQLRFHTFVLGPDQLNAGEQYKAYVDHPLEVALQPEVQEQPVLRVGSIALDYRPGRDRSLVVARVGVPDQDDQPVRQAAVDGMWTLPDGSTFGQARPTGDAGLARFELRTALSGRYRFCVGDLVKAGAVYDPAQNTGTCEVLSVP